jgi:hypothetical protein
MTPRQCFKAAFLARCAADGLSEAETVAAIATLEKSAGAVDWIKALPLAGAAGAVGDTVKLVGGLGLAGSLVAGGGLGYLAARAREGNVDPEEIRKQELVAAYNTFSDQMERDRRPRPTPPRRTYGMR